MTPFFVYNVGYQTQQNTKGKSLLWITLYSIERLNRTFKESYRITCGYGTEDGAIHSVSLWVAYYNFLRPHEKSGGKEPLNKVELLEGAGNMPGKWQLLIYLGQQAILKQQSEAAICS